MVQLTTRQKNVLCALTEASGPIPVKTLATVFQVSPRTIRYDLDHIGYWLKERGIELEKKQNQGVSILGDEATMEGIQREINLVRPNISVLTQKDRKYYILLELLKADSISTSEGLSKLLGVSRATVLKDLKDVSQELKEYGLRLESKQGTGYRVVGDEHHIRRVIGKILLSSLDTQKLLQFLTNLDQELLPHSTYLQEVSSSISIQEIKNAIKYSKSKYQFWIPDNHYIALITHIAIALDRLLKGMKIELPQEKIHMIKRHREYEIAMEIGAALERVYGVEIPEAELAHITIHLLSADLKIEYGNQEALSSEVHNLEETIEIILEPIKYALDTREESYQKLKADLCSHLKLTLKKHRLNILSENPLIEQIRDQYRECYALAEQVAEGFEARTKVRLNEDEIGYIALHLAAHREGLKEKPRKRGLVICTTGKGSAKILAMRLKNNLPELEIQAVISIFELEENQHLLDGIDLIISTIDVQKFQRPVFKVSPIITKEELGQIRNFLYQENVPSFENLSSFKGAPLEKVQGKVGEWEMQWAEDTAMILTEVASMMKELGLEEGAENRANYWGLIIHVVMAIPRWRAGDYNEESEIDAYRKNHAHLYQIVRKYLDRIAANHHLQIPDGEVIAVMRYVTNL